VSRRDAEAFADFCTVVTGVCTPVAEDVGSLGDRLAIPIGIGIYNS
jgi:hypothetical protein